jgi:hypothetical protein
MVYMEMCIIVSGYRDTVLGIYKYESIVNGHKEREITVSITLMLIQCLNDKLVT